MVRILSIQGFRLFDSAIDIILTFGFGHDIVILKMAIFVNSSYIDIEPAQQYTLQLLIIFCLEK